MSVATRPRLRTKTGCLTCESEPSTYGRVAANLQKQADGAGRNATRSYPSVETAALLVASASGRHPQTCLIAAMHLTQHHGTEQQKRLISMESIPHWFDPGPWNAPSEAAVAHRVMSQDLELRISRHFVDKYYSLLILPSCHPGFHDGWLAEIQELMVTYKSLYYSVLACAATHIYLVDASQRMKDLALTFYSGAVKELSNLLKSVPELENHNGLLMSVMLLYLHGVMSWDTEIDCPQHVHAAARILTLRLLRRPVGIGRLFDRLAIESVMYQMFGMMTGLWSDSTQADYKFDLSFWEGAEKLLGRSTLLPGASRGFDSPVLGIPVSLFRTVLSLRQYFRSGGSPDPQNLSRVQADVSAWEAQVLSDQSLLPGSPPETEGPNPREKYVEDACYLFAMVASLLLEQISQSDIVPRLPMMVSRDCWQARLGMQILEQNAYDERWTRSFIANWPIYTLGLFLESDADRKSIQVEFRRRWDLTKFTQVTHFRCDLEDIWAARDGKVCEELE
ncbi:hypothetical protein NM208_g7776 [Fusarium decemcellulare]|uniref:Uncharacterized protein n=1 Tax=Fusarium decemcellulare TaxID=57161 RepID=A0ACC1S804_9HYPO|nr:hypothetical protein NM208_g7776 [Fusarium decemcellulare]